MNEGTRTYSRHADYTEAEKKYRPNSKQSQFDLPLFELPHTEMCIYSANPPDELKEFYLGADAIRFPIHPQVLTHCRQDPYVARTLAIGKPLNPITVSPSSSTRTLYAELRRPFHAIKVHFPFRISRYGRRMRQEVLEQAINVSRELEKGISHLDRDFAFLREVVGVAHRNIMPDSPRGENWGYLVRDMTPFPRIAKKHTLLPGFALYGKDFFKPQRDLLLYRLIGQKDPREFVLNGIMLPIIRHWVSCFKNFGYLIEPHGQNVLLEVSINKEINRIVHRDLSIGIDMRRRRDLKLPDSGLNAYNRMEKSDFHSIVYDKFMGGHFFDRLVDACCMKYPHLKAEDFRRPCRDEFANIFPAHRTYFPPTIRYFSEERDKFGKPLYKDTRLAPRWRP